jgi:hypothetical protein
MEGYNDDLVISLSIGLWIRDTALKLYQEGVAITKVAIDNFKRRSSQVEGIFTNNHLTHDPYAIEVGNNPLNPQKEDLRWLL